MEILSKISLLGMDEMMGHVRKLLFSGFILLSVVVSVIVYLICNQRITIKDVYGSYSYSHSIGKEVLTLNPNGTYSQRISLLTGVLLNNGGTWTFNSSFGVMLSNAIIIDGVSPIASTQPVSGMWVLDIRRTFGGHIELIIDDDKGLAFK